MAQRRLFSSFPWARGCNAPSSATFGDVTDLTEIRFPHPALPFLGKRPLMQSSSDSLIINDRTISDFRDLPGVSPPPRHSLRGQRCPAPQPPHRAFPACRG
ncbi:MAG: hypothetical protein H6668_19055 [Ardenticatenaceae bacterium]|nr:hypothetical protein [Ardenticatenaceae bacterium]